MLLLKMIGSSAGPLGVFFSLFFSLLFFRGLAWFLLAFLLGVHAFAHSLGSLCVEFVSVSGYSRYTFHSGFIQDKNHEDLIRNTTPLTSYSVIAKAFIVRRPNR
jgi:hypothetical protein